MERENLHSEMVTEDGLCNLDLFRLLVTGDVVKCIISIPPPHLKVDSNFLIWVGSSNGSFSINSAY